MALMVLISSFEKFISISLVYVYIVSQISVFVNPFLRSISYMSVIPLCPFPQPMNRVYNETVPKFKSNLFLSMISMS